MRKFLFANLTILAILSGCASTKSIVDFTSEDKSYKFSLASDDNFQTAVMFDSNGKKRILKSVVSADGIKMADEKGTSVHFKKGYGILNLNGGADINVRYKE